MKFAHLSDLHLGIRFSGYSLIEDQRFILDRILEIIEENNVDGVIVAGDIYDKSVPPAEAVSLFDEFITRVCQLGKPLYIISGNHDSPERIAFGGDIFSKAGVFISHVYDGTVRRVTAQDEYGSVNIFLMPFVKPANVHQFYPDEECKTYTDAVKIALSHSDLDPTERNVLVCHQFVTGASTCDSEQRIVGTLENVEVSAFDGFDYCALGHIHGPQKVSRDTVRYCGTPLKYSFSEVDHKKSLTLVELCEKGNVTVSTVPLVPLRDMRILRGTYDELAFVGNRTDDYICAVLTDEEDVPNAMDRLRNNFPYIAELKYDNKRTRTVFDVESVGKAEQMSPIEIFEELYKGQNGTEMTEEQKKYVTELAEEIWGEF